MKKIKTGCPRDCIDVCSMVAHVDGDTLVKVTGDPDHPYTKGWLCAKGNSYLERVYHCERILHPLKRDRSTGQWTTISWEDAYRWIEEELTDIKEKYGSTAVFHNYDAGSSGVLKSLDRRFFNAYGGVTEPLGSLCWSSGRKAQQYDFGDHGANSMMDVEDSQCIVLWGRDIARTNQHIVPFVQTALSRGAKLVVINPRETEFGKKADLLLQPRPGSDGALALAVANYLIKKGLIDQEFVDHHVQGFASFAQSLKPYTLPWAEEVTGINRQLIVKFAEMYGQIHPASILIGYGLQRYTNGGTNVRAIHALGALTGNIGVQGGGVNYAGKKPWDLEDRIIGEELASNRRYVLRANLGEELLRIDDPPIQAAFITRSNPLCQSPDMNKVRDAFQKIPFVVVIDQFMTDSARQADLVLPCTTIFEQNDIITSSWTEWLTVARKAIEPLGESKSDQQIFIELAQRMKLPGFHRSLDQWFLYACEPLLMLGLGPKLLIGGGVFHPQLPPVAWKDKQFPTPSGKYELYSLGAEQDGHPPLPLYREGEESPNEHYPLYFLSPHSAHRINSQFGREQSIQRLNPEPLVEIHPETAALYGIEEGDSVRITSPRGQIRARAQFKQQMSREVVMVESGWWEETGASANCLTTGKVADFGLGAAFYDCCCKIKREN